MRTYTRKRPEYKPIDGVAEKCRLCLGSKEVSVPIFNEDADQLCATLSLRIMICVGLEMTRDTYLPNAICVECYKELERYYTFRKKCEVTYQKLKAHVLAMKEKHYNMVNMKPKEEAVEEAVMAVETDDGQEQLVLTFDENQQIQLVNLVNSNSIHLGNSENLFNPSEVELADLPNEIVKLQPDVENILPDCTQESTTSPLEVQYPECTESPLEVQASSSDLSLIMSTMLLELGVLRQDEDRLVLVDEDLRTVELEGADNTKIILQLVEEDEEGQSVSDGAKQSDDNHIENSQSTFTLLKHHKGRKKKPNSCKTDTTCPVCKKKFASRSVLTRHSRVHTGVRPYACALCPRSFAQRAVLKRHELVHRDKRPFACSMCDKSFTQRGALEMHARRHAPLHARPIALHACSACDKVFLYASGLSRHMAVHAGRRYPCACGRSFADRSALQRHRRRCLQHRAGDDN